MAQAITADRRSEVEHNPGRFAATREDPAKGAQTREERAWAEAMTVTAEIEDGVATGRYFVESESGRSYTVDLTDTSCSCPDWKCNCQGENKCKHFQRVAIEITQSGLAAPNEEVFEFAVNDVVCADWSEGEGPKDVILGVVTSIEEVNGQIIVGVTDYHADNYALGKTYDCAPEWIYTPDSEESTEETDDETDDEVPPGKQCVMCPQKAENPAEHGALCTDCKPE